MSSATSENSAGGDVRERYDYLVVGGGVTADAAARGIRERDADGTIAVLTDEVDPPVTRPALSKKLWLDEEWSEGDAVLSTADDTGATVLTGHRVTAVDVEAREVRAATGVAGGGSGGEATIGYGRLLVATGGHPRRIEGLDPGDRVVYFRTLADYRTLRGLADGGPHVAVVGGGFIGTEIAAALVQNGCRVTLLHPDDVLGAPTFPTPLARRVERVFTDHDVTVRGGVEVQGGEVGDDGVRLALSDGGTFEADAVVVGLGIEPATDFLPAGVEKSDDGGVVVDEHLATSATDVWAAGDVAQYPDAVLGRRRVEHVDNAETMGAAVGRILAGSDETYDHLPMYYSDLFDQWYEAVGTLDASLTTVEDAPDGPDGDALVVYYLGDGSDGRPDGEVVGVLLWDCDGGLDAAKDLLARHERPADPQSLVGSIF